MFVISRVKLSYLYIWVKVTENFNSKSQLSTTYTMLYIWTNTYYLLFVIYVHLALFKKII